MTLYALLDKAGVTNYDRVFWFNIGKPDAATLAGSVLTVSRRDVGEFIAKHWGAAMREALPDLRIVVRAATPKTPKSKVWKPGKEPTTPKLGGI